MSIVRNGLLVVVALLSIPFDLQAIKARNSEGEIGWRVRKIKEKVSVQEDIAYETDSSCMAQRINDLHESELPVCGALFLWKDKPDIATLYLDPSCYRTKKTKALVGRINRRIDKIAKKQK